MKLDDPHVPGPAVLRIEGELTIFRAAELKPLLLADPLPLEIDLSGVTDIDTAGVQLAKNTAREQQRELRLVAHSPAVKEVFALLDLAGCFSGPLAAPAFAVAVELVHES